jgi:hypothetical protein
LSRFRHGAADAQKSTSNECCVSDPDAYRAPSCFLLTRWTRLTSCRKILLFFMSFLGNANRIILIFCWEGIYLGFFPGEFEIFFSSFLLHLPFLSTFGYLLFFFPLSFFCFSSFLLLICFLAFLLFFFFAFLLFCVLASLLFCFFSSLLSSAFLLFCFFCFFCFFSFSAFLLLCFSVFPLFFSFCFSAFCYFFASLLVRFRFSVFLLL